MIPYSPEQVSRIDKLIRGNGIGLVYVVAYDAAGPVKIGKTTFLAVRLDGLQTGNPNKLYVFAAFLAQADQTWSREGRIHSELVGKRLCGEWFAITVHEAKQACRLALRRPVAMPIDESSVPMEGQSGTMIAKPKKATNRAALRAIYKKHIAEMSLRVPQCPPKKSRKWALQK